MLERIRKFENMHILFWLGKDISWCMEWKVLGVVMIIPTITLAVLITWLTRHEKKDMYHNIAICFWISANSFWMIGEFFGYDSFRTDARFLFFAGFAFIFWFYLSDYIIARRKQETL